MERSYFHSTRLCMLIFVVCKLMFLSSACEEVERQALLSFKQSLSDPANRLSSWSGPNCCTWSGISCHNRTGRVIKLDLRNRHPDQYGLLFSGQEVNSSLLHLKSLQYLDLSWNDFQSTPIPNFFGYFHQLRYLNLSSSWFGGVVPHHLGNLSNLRSLDLSGSYTMRADSLSWVSGLSSLRFLDISGVELSSSTSNPLQAINLLPRLLELRLAGCSMSTFLPNLDSYLPNLTSLTLLDLSDNFDFILSFPSRLQNFTSLKLLNLAATGLEGPLPSFVGSMTKLEEIHLHSNHLKGTVENVFSKMCNLKSLLLWGNSFHGEFPNLFQNSSCLQTSRLEVLNLSDNEFNGTVPPSLGKFTSLRSLDLSANQFHGVMSEVHFDKVSNLIYLHLSGNSLSLQMRSGWLPPFQLDSISLSSTNVGPEFPLWLTTQNRLNTLDLSDTSLRGELPQSIFNFSLSDSSHHLFIDLSSNPLQGKIPNILKSNDQELILVLNNNNFEGILPYVPPNTTVLDLSHNSFSGTITNSFCKFKGLQILKLSVNKFTGGFPSCLCGLQNLLALYISSNQLAGVVPECIGKLYQLKQLHLRDNRFHGKIPSSMKNCTDLDVLDLSDNKFSGKIHPWIGANLQHLRFLSLRSNELSGTVPLQLCWLQNLQFLDLAQNNISGTIPLCFSNFTQMVTGSHSPLKQLSAYSAKTETIHAITTGKEVEYSYILTYVSQLDLSSNDLVGGIPESVIKLHGLQALNLSRNQLEGNIIGEIGDLVHLESLDLSQNKFSGKIPPSISSLTFLSHLNLSQNNFTGEISSSNQLQTLDDPSIYMGNPQLCGTLLQNKCWAYEPQEGHSKIENHDTNDTKIYWIYIGMASGYMVGFGGFCVFFLNPKWRYAYYRF